MREYVVIKAKKEGVENIIAEYEKSTWIFKSRYPMLSQMCRELRELRKKEYLCTQEKSENSRT